MRNQPREENNLGSLCLWYVFKCFSSYTLKDFMYLKQQKWNLSTSKKGIGVFLFAFSLLLVLNWDERITWCCTVQNNTSVPGVWASGWETDPRATSLFEIWEWVYTAKWEWRVWSLLSSLFKCQLIPEPYLRLLLNKNYSGGLWQTHHVTVLWTEKHRKNVIMS